MHPRFRLTFLAVATLVLIVPLAACGSSGTTVAVTLQEWSISADKTSVPAGSVTFNATNNGPDAAHEMVLLKTDIAPGDLPTDSTGKADEEADGVTNMGEITDLAVGADGTLTVDLTAGNYILVCNIVDTNSGQTQAHYMLGMRMAFTVQ